MAICIFTRNTETKILLQVESARQKIEVNFR